MAEQTIDQLNIEINAGVKQSSSGMDKLIASIEKLKIVTGGGVGGLTGIAASIQKLTSVLSGMKSQSGIVSSLANSINKLNDARTDRISGSIKTLTDSLKTLGGMDSGLKTIISDLATLSRSGGGNTTVDALKLQAEAAKTQATIDKSALASTKAQEGLKAIADKNKQIADSAQQAAAQEKEMLDSVDSAIDNYWAKQHAQNAEPVVWNRTTTRFPSSTATSVESLKQAVGDIGSTAANGMNQVSRGSSRATGFVNKLKDSLNSAKEKLSGLGTSSNSFFSMGKFYGWYFILRQIANTFGGFINNINGYIENMNLFDVAMGKSAQSGEKLAQSLQNVLGVDSGEAMRYMGVFEELGTSFGIANKQATTMSKNLTQLGYDLASFYNISTQTSFEKLESGITGQSRALRQLGIDTSSARLQQELYNLGFKEKVDDLTQADKAELRYIAIMKQSTQVQGDMARTIQTPANALRVLQAQLTIAGRAIGSIFIPALNAILPPAIAVVEIIGEMASSVASLVGFKMPKIDYSSLKNITGSADDASTAVGNIGDNAKKSKKQLDNLISGFDELNVIQKDSDSGSESGAGGNILSGINLPSYNALTDAVSNNIDAIKEKLEQYKPLIAEILKDSLAIGAALLTWKLTNGLFNGLMDLIPGLKEFKGQFIEIAAGLALVSGLFVFAYTHSENFRRGLDVLGSGIQWIGKEIEDFAVGAAKSLGIKELSGEFWTSTAAVVVIAIGAVAIALGAPVFGAIAIIGGAAVLAIQGIGYAASDSIPKVNLFGDGISEATKKKIEPFIKSMDKLDQTIKAVKWSGKVVTESDVSNVKSQVKQITDTIINQLDSDKNEALKKLDPLKGVLNSKTYNEIIKANQTHYDTMQKNVSDGEKQINSIMQKAKDEHRGLKQGEYDEISKIEEKMKTTGIKYLSESQTESNLIFQNLKDNHTALSAQEASEIVKNSVKSRDETIKNANNQYSGILTEAQRMLDVGTINKDQYDQIRDAAGKSKDDTIKQATEQHTKIVDEAKKQAGDLSKEVDWSTGDIKSKWTVFWEDTQKKFKDGWTGVRTFFQKSIPEWWNKDIAPWFTKEKWQELAQPIKDSISGKWDELKTWWNSLGPVKWWKEDVEPWFTAEKWSNLGKDAMNGLVKGISSIHIPTPHFNFGWESIKDYDNLAAKAAKALGYGGGVPTLDIDWYANGGAFSGASIIGVGEYPNASSNPEVVAPQSIIRETVDESNDNVVAAIYAMAQQIVQAVQEKDTSVILNDKVLAKSTNKVNANSGYNLGLQSI
ncbi:hypothetical protein [Caproiciproducens sp.]|uniref:hypothetical protein n=1 Tax=Caproiciproducens sp. TaxID=1954376 RepID=UPI002899BA2A|nr:hypothetical protein [Caproiciproducens sp.]